LLGGGRGLLSGPPGPMLGSPPWFTATGTVSEGPVVHIVPLTPPRPSARLSLPHTLTDIPARRESRSTSVHPTTSPWPRKSQHKIIYRLIPNTWISYLNVSVSWL
jgi:hypothetical protein